MLLFEQVTLFLFSLSGYLLNSCKLLAPTQSCGKKFHRSTQNKTTILAEAFRVTSRTGDKVFQLFFMVPYPASKTFSLWSATALDFFHRPGSQPVVINPGFGSSKQLHWAWSPAFVIIFFLCLDCFYMLPTPFNLSFTWLLSPPHFVSTLNLIGYFLSLK